MHPHASKHDADVRANARLVDQGSSGVKESSGAPQRRFEQNEVAEPGRLLQQPFLRERLRLSLGPETLAKRHLLPGLRRQHEDPVRPDDRRRDDEKRVNTQVVGFTAAPYLSSTAYTCSNMSTGSVAPDVSSRSTHFGRIPWRGTGQSSFRCG